MHEPLGVHGYTVYISDGSCQERMDRLVMLSNIEVMGCKSLGLLQVERVLDGQMSSTMTRHNSVASRFAIRVEVFLIDYRVEGSHIWSPIDLAVVLIFNIVFFEHHGAMFDAVGPWVSLFDWHNSVDCHL